MSADAVAAPRPLRTPPRGTRRHLPVHSPLPAAALGRAAAEALVDARAVRRRLAATLCTDFAADGVLLTASGTDALRLAIHAALQHAGGERIVALPAFSCYDVATAALGAGAHIALYDLDPATLGPDPASVTATLRAGARAVVVAPLFGLPCAWETLEATAREYGAVLIEDAAQGHGAAWHGRPLGSLAPLSILSFGRGKGWTGGGGGALLWRGGGAAATTAAGLTPPAAPARAGLTTLTAAAAQAVLGHPGLYALPAALPWLRLGDTIYHSPRPPHGIPAAAAALVLATRDAASREATARRIRAALLREQLGPAAAAIHVPPGARPGWLRLPIRLPTASAAAAVRGLRHLGVGPAYPTTLAELPAVHARLISAPGRHAGLPGATSLVRELLTVPTHGRLRETERGFLVTVLTAAATPQGGG